MKRIFKITWKRVVAMFLLTSMLLTANADLLLTYAVGANVSAKIYSDSALTNELTDLSGNNAGITGWAQNTTRTLRVDVDSLEEPASGYYQLVISMDRALYLSTPDRTAENWVESQSQEKYGPIKVNDNKDRNAYNNSGTFTYKIASGIDFFGVSFEVNYDWALWDHRDNSVLGYNARYLYDTATPLLSVKLQLVNGGNTTDVYVGNLKSATSGAGVTLDAAFNGFTDSGDRNTISYAVMDDVFTMRYNGVAGFLVPGDYVLTVNVPYWEQKDSNGNVIATHYLEFDERGCYYSNIQGIADVEYAQTASNKLTVTFHNLIMTGSNPYYYIGFKLPESVETYDANPVSSMPTFSGGSITAQMVETVNGQKVTYDIPKQSTGVYSIKMVSSTKVMLSFSSYEHKGLLWSQKESVQSIAAYTINNVGVLDTGEVTVNFISDTPATCGAGMTDIRLPLPKGQTTTVYFKMIQCTRDGSGNVTGGTKMNEWLSVQLTNDTGTNASGVLFSRKDLGKYNPEYATYSSGDYYFNEIIYVISNIPAQTALYDNSGISSPNSAGTMWGYAFRNDISVDAEIYRTQFDFYLGNVLKDGSGSLINGASSSRKQRFIHKIQLVSESSSSNQRASYAIDNMRLKKDNGSKVYSHSIDPGETAVFTAKFSMYNYVYRYRSCADNIRFALLLPNDVTLKGVKGTLDNGRVLETGANDNSNKITLSTQAQSDSSQTLWIITIPSSIKLGYYQEGLTALADGAGIDLEFTVSTWQNTASKSIVLSKDRLFVVGKGMPQMSSGTGYVAQHYRAYDTYNLLGLASPSSVSSEYRNVGTVLDTHSAVTLSIAQSKAQLEITNQFTDTQTKTSTMDGTEDTVGYEFSLSCVNGGTVNEFVCYVPVPKGGVHGTEFMGDTAISLKLSGPATVSYSSDAVTRMKVLYTTATGFTYDQLSDGTANVQWKTAANVADWSAVTMIKLVPEQAGAGIQNGSVIKLSAQFICNMTTKNYIANSGKIAAWNSIGYYEYENGTNQSAGHFYTDQVKLQLAYTAPEQIVTVIAGSNDAGEKTGSLDLDAVLAQFGSKVSYTVQNVQIYGGFSLLPTQSTAWNSLDSSQSNTQFGITAKVNSNTAVDLIAGQSADLKQGGTGTSETLSFTVYHGNAITENASAMAVTLNLVGSNSTVVPVRVIIKRVLTPAQPGEPGIVGGNQYALFDSTEESVSVSRGSAATAQFVVSYIPKNYNCPQLILTDNSITGKILMIDWSNTANPVYYQADAAATITLSSFQKIDGSGPYTHSSSSSLKSQSLLFVLPEVNANGTVTFKMTQTGGGEASTTALKYTVVNSRSFSLSADKTNGTVDDEIEFSYSSSCVMSDGNDSEYQNRQMALVVSGTNVPADMLLDVDGVQYQKNIYGEYIISLVNAQQANNDTSVTVRPVSNTKTKANITLTATLYVGADVNSGLRPKSEQVADPVSVVLNPVADAPAFEIRSMDPDRVLTRANLSRTITVTADWRNITSSNITVELYKTDGFGYIASNFLNDGYTWSDKVLQMSLSEQTTAGTYQLRFIIEKNGIQIVIPYNFVLIDG